MGAALRKSRLWVLRGAVTCGARDGGDPEGVTIMVWED